MNIHALALCRFVAKTAGGSRDIADGQRAALAKEGNDLREKVVTSSD
jgi:hypothetical protein